MISLKYSLPFLLILTFALVITNQQTNISTPVQQELNLISEKLSFDVPLIADHTIMNIVRHDQIPDGAINNSKNTLHIAYGHTSHGSQIITGMTGLPTFKEGTGGFTGLYNWNEGGIDGALDIDDYFVSGDLGNPDFITWSNRTREYLDNPTHSDVNVVMWSWCGQVSSATDSNIDLYLSLMNDLESSYPNIFFVYMTGHTDGSGLTGNLHLRNNQIRNYCQTNNKILYDFEDIESYDPDLNYFGDKNVTDSCNYDGGNWATDWQNSHPENVDWYSCSPAHSLALNGNQKAYAAWWLWAKLSGWNSSDTQETTTSQITSTTRSTSSDASSSSDLVSKSSTSLSSNESNGTNGFSILTLSITLFAFIIAKRKRGGRTKASQYVQ
jgi:hypothetical protein